MSTMTPKTDQAINILEFLLRDECPLCGSDLDTGYECGKCGNDWLNQAQMYNLDIIKAQRRKSGQ